MSKIGQMRFFPHEWPADEDDAAADRVVAAYEANLRSFRGAPGRHIRELNSKHSLNTALLDSLQVFRKLKKVEFALIAGDQQAGYSLLTLKYRHARIRGATPRQLADIFNRRHVDIRYNEFDRIGRRERGATQTFVHRFLLWPRELGVLAIEFQDMRYSAQPLPCRTYTNFGIAFELF